ncbi:MAG: hypothetical protein ABI672_10350 [Vicinamibacteria bacterium]
MKAICVGLALIMAAASSADEYGTLVTVTGETPVAVPFLKCRRLDREAATDTTPALCKDRESKDTFSTRTARVTNLGDTIVWVHVGEDKVPVLPRTTFNPWSPSVGFRRIFLSANAGEVAFVHVFASDPIQYERHYVYPEPEHSRE